MRAAMVVFEDQLEVRAFSEREEKGISGVRPRARDKSTLIGGPDMAWFSVAIGQVR